MNIKDLDLHSVGIIVEGWWTWSMWICALLKWVKHHWSKVVAFFNDFPTATWTLSSSHACSSMAMTWSGVVEKCRVLEVMEMKMWRLRKVHYYCWRKSVHSSYNRNWEVEDWIWWIFSDHFLLLFKLKRGRLDFSLTQCRVVSHFLCLVFVPCVVWSLEETSPR